MSNVVPLPRPEPPFRKEALDFVYCPPGTTVELRAEHVRRKNEDYHGSFRASVNNIQIHRASLNFAAPRSRKEVARACAGESNGGSLEGWTSWLEVFAVAVMDAVDAGPEWERLGDIPLVAAPPDLIHRFIPKGVITSIYGPGGSTKSLLAKLAALAVANDGQTFARLGVNEHGPVAYFDWEDWRDRVRRHAEDIKRGMGMGGDPFHNVWYVNMKRYGPLKNHARALAQACHERGILFAVVDSVEKAIGSGSEGTTYEARANAFDEALSLFSPITILTVDHVSHESRKNTKGVNAAIGSVMKGNWTRQSWEVRKTQEVDEPRAVVGLHWYKGNDGPPGRPLGFEITWAEDGATVVRPYDVGSEPEQRDKLSQPQQVFAVLRTDGAQTLADLSDLTGIPKPTLSTVLNRQFKLGKLAHLPGDLWGLAADNVRRLPSPQQYKDDDDEQFPPF